MAASGVEFRRCTVPSRQAPETATSKPLSDRGLEVAYPQRFIQSSVSDRKTITAYPRPFPPADKLQRRDYIRKSLTSQQHHEDLVYIEAFQRRTSKLRNKMKHSTLMVITVN